MKLALLFALLVCITTASAQDDSIKFKGLALGSSEEEVLKHYPRAICSGASERRRCFAPWGDRDRPMADKAVACRRAGIVECSGRSDDALLTIAGVPVPFINFSFFDNALGSISLRPDAQWFDKISSAMLDAYGKPLFDETETVRTRAGVTYQNRKLTWKKPDGMIRAYRFGSSIDQSMIAYESSEWHKRMFDEVKKNREKAAKDL